MIGFWRELRAVLLVGALTAGVVGAFPFSALDFEARHVPVSRDASAAFIVLTDEEESLALKVAKSAWQSEASATQRMRVRLPLGELPEEEPSSPLEFHSDVFAVPEATPVAYPFPPGVPSQAAEVPRRLSPEPESVPAPAFSRDDLLNFN